MRIFNGLLFTLFLCIFITGVASAQVPPARSSSPIDNLKVKFAGSSLYMADQPLQVTYTMTNDSNVPLHVLIWGTPLEGIKSDLFEITGPRGKVRYLGPLVSRIGPYPSDYVTIQPHQSISRTVNLATVYEIVDGGAYIVTPRLHRAAIALRKPTHAAADRALNFKTIKADTIRFNQSGNRILPDKMRPVSGARRIVTPYNLVVGAGAEGALYREPRFDLMCPGTSTSGSILTDPTKIASAKKAYTEALNLAAAAKVLLNGTTAEEIKRGAERYRAYFGAYDPGRSDMVRTTYGTIYGFGFTPGAPDSCADTFHRSYANDPVFIYAADPATCCTDRQQTDCCAQDDCPGSCCDPRVTSGRCCASVAGGVLSYEMDHGMKYIYLCPVAWNLPVSSAVDSQAGVVLHEMSHLANRAVIDHYYGEQECMSMAQTTPSDAVSNADSYHRFAMNLYGLGMGLERQSIKLLSQGGALMAQQGGGGDLNACGAVGSSMAIFTLSSPRQSKLVYDPGSGSLKGARSNVAVYVPGNGDQVKLITSNRKNVVSATQSSSGTVRADGSDSQFYLLKKMSGQPGAPIQDGDGVALQAHGGLYLAAKNCDVTMAAEAATGTIFKASMSEVNVPRRYFAQLRTSGNYYLASENGGGGALHARQRDSSTCTDCTFILVDRNGGDLKSGDSVFLMSYNGVHYVGDALRPLPAPRGARQGMTATESIAAVGQTFVIEKIIPSRMAQQFGLQAIHTVDRVRFRSGSGNSYLQAVNGGGGIVSMSESAPVSVNRPPATGLSDTATQFIIELGR